ncbi:MAG: hypothetical protein GX791_05975 [Synergistaceae bacterium]|nr:hypothetical protein [Synergistaceae bacterium]
MGNITFSFDKEVLRRGREYAKRHNISFKALVRCLVEQTVSEESSQWLEDTFSLMDRRNASSRGKKWTRDKLYCG